MSKHIWYSGATDLTGKNLADRLELQGTKQKPANLASGDLIIGWGAKIKEPVNIRAGVTVWNHPNKIKINRDKLQALNTMSEDNNLTSNIAKFCTADQVLAKLSARRSGIDIPLIGRKKYHQGGKGFWTCLTKRHVQKAIEEGAEYFQNYIDIVDEYRLHVAFGQVIHAVRKEENATEAGWVAQRKEKIEDYAQKNSWNLDGNTIDRSLSVLYREQSLPDWIIRSNKKGWKFSRVNITNLPAALKNAAVKSVEVLGLTFGAVDCVISDNNHPYILEVNSGPGLQGSALDRYVEVFSEKIAALDAPAAKAAKAVKASKAAMAAGVGAENADANASGGKMNSKALQLMMNAVESPEEARAVLDAWKASQ